MKSSFFSSKIIVFSLYLISVFLFIMGLTHPIMSTERFFGMTQDTIYITGSIEYFIKKNDWFLAIVLLVFTLVLPILKYIVIGLKLLNVRFIFQKGLYVFIDIINKWAMLDVFVVALVIVNLKFDSVMIKTQNDVGTAYFGASVLILMVCSYILTKTTENKTLYS